MGYLFIYYFPSLDNIVDRQGVILFFDINNGFPKVFLLTLFLKIGWTLFDEVPLFEIGVWSSCQGGYLWVLLDDSLVELLQELLVIDMAQTLEFGYPVSRVVRSLVCQVGLLILLDLLVPFNLALYPQVLGYLEQAKGILGLP